MNHCFESLRIRALTEALERANEQDRTLEMQIVQVKQEMCNDEV